MYFETISAAFKNRGDANELLFRTIEAITSIKEFKESNKEIYHAIFNDSLFFNELFLSYVDYLINYSGGKGDVSSNEIDQTSIHESYISMLIEYYTSSDFSNKMQSINYSLANLFNDCVPAGPETVGIMLKEFCVDNNINPLYLLIFYDTKAHEILG